MERQIHRIWVLEETAAMVKLTKRWLQSQGENQTAELPFSRKLSGNTGQGLWEKTLRAAAGPSSDSGKQTLFILCE